MCGVMGYVGHRHAKERLLKGLERLEYRGYDSAGLCLVGDRELESTRAVGKLENLKIKLDGATAEGTTGIAHTRWATHGRVTERNAHPLVSGNGHGPEVAIVLNGIIENHVELRTALTEEGFVFASDTDAEVLAHLLRRAYQGSLMDAVRAVYERLEGHFAFIAVHRDQPDLLVGARRQCPLLVGVGDGEAFIASAVAAFSAETRRVVVLEDDELVAVTADEIRVFGHRGDEREREELQVTWDDEAADKHGYESFMLKEIHEQPTAVHRTVERNLDPATVAAALNAVKAKSVRRILVVACGTAYHAGLVGRHALETWAGVPVDVEVASEWRYRDPLMTPNTLVIGISQSGETADTLAALRLGRSLGAHTLAITNSPGSQITREVDAVLYTHAGIETGVAATKTFTTQVALLALLALRLGERRGWLTGEVIEHLLDQLRALPRAILQGLEGLGGVEAVARRHCDKPFFFFLGRQIGVPVCQEGALKLKEITYIPAESYPAGEMKHGPIALLDERTPVVAVATEAAVADKLASNLMEVRARGAEVIAVACADDARIAAAADDVLVVPRTHPLLQPAVSVLPLQLLSYRIAMLRGLDVDQPRNLAKSVTVE